MKIQRRLELLEKRLMSEPIMLLMPDGRTETLSGRRYYTLDLFKRACDGDRTPDLELIARHAGPPANELKPFEPFVLFSQFLSAGPPHLPSSASALAT
jgi:hypothetical protein